MMWSESILKLDLRMCNTIEDCRLLCEDNGISPESISDEKLFSYKGVIDIFFYDKVTFSVMAIIPSDSDKIQFTDDFVHHLFDLVPIKFKRRKLDLDEIFNKISLIGINLSNNQEKGASKKF